MGPLDEITLGRGEPTIQVGVENIGALRRRAMGGPKLGSPEADRLYSAWEASRLEPEDDDSMEPEDDGRTPEDDDREATDAEYDAMEGGW